MIVRFHIHIATDGTIRRTCPSIVSSTTLTQNTKFNNYHHTFSVVHPCLHKCLLCVWNTHQRNNRSFEMSAQILSRWPWGCLCVPTSRYQRKYISVYATDSLQQENGYGKPFHWMRNFLNDYRSQSTMSRRLFRFVCHRARFVIQHVSQNRSVGQITASVLTIAQ